MPAEYFIVTGADGTTDTTYYKASQNGYTSRWAASDNTSSVKRFIDVEHAIKPAGALGTDIHTLTLRREEVDSETSKLYVSKVSVQVSYPRTDSISASDIGNDISHIMSLFHKDFMTTFVQGATPSGDFNVTGPFNPVRA